MQALITSTAAELNLLDGVSGLVQADFTKLAAVDSTAAELNKLDGVGTLAQAGKQSIWIPAAAITPTKSNFRSPHQQSRVEMHLLWMMLMLE